MWSRISHVAPVFASGPAAILQMMLPDGDRNTPLSSARAGGANAMVAISAAVEAFMVMVIGARMHSVSALHVAAVVRDK